MASTQFGARRKGINLGKKYFYRTDVKDQVFLALAPTPHSGHVAGRVCLGLRSAPGERGPPLGRRKWAGTVGGLHGPHRPFGDEASQGTVREPRKASPSPEWAARMSLGRVQRAARGAAGRRAGPAEPRATLAPSSCGEGGHQEHRRSSCAFPWKSAYELGQRLGRK